MALVPYGARPAYNVARLAFRHRRELYRGARAAANAVRDFVERRRADLIDRRLQNRVRRNQQRQEPQQQDATMAGVGDLGVYQNDSHYKRKRTLGKVNIRKLAKIGTKALYDRWQRMGLYGAAYGSNWLARGVDNPLAEDDTTVLAGWTARPLYMWDLTSTRNYINAVEKVPAMAWQLLSNTAAGTFAWKHIRGQNIGTGAPGNFKNSSRWQWMTTPRSGQVDEPYDGALLDWVKIQAVFWGSKKQSHKIYLEIVQMDPIFTPSQAPVGHDALGALDTAITLPTYDEQGGSAHNNVAYTNIVTRMVDSPFATWAHQQRNMNLRVLDRKVLEFAPVASFEENGDAQVHKQTVNSFIKFGRKLNYAWENDNTESAGVLGDAAIEGDIEKGMHSVIVHPRARVYLRIWATNYVGDTEDNTYAPSFDLRITRKLIVDGM